MEGTKTPIELVTALLAEMTERAMEAERQRDIAEKDAETWYTSYLSKDKQLREANEKLLEYLKASGNTDMIKITEAPKWGEFKKRLEIIGETVIDNVTGEIVEGVEVIENPDNFIVEV